MRTPSSISKIVQNLVISFLATCLLAAWPMSAEAKGNNGGHSSHSDIQITKHVDSASSKVSAKKGTPSKTFTNFGDIKGESTDKDHKDW
jgi:type VI protein secretion system component Hcp